jgi:hypothetical protein
MNYPKNYIASESSLEDIDRINPGWLKNAKGHYRYILYDIDIKYK